MIKSLNLDSKITWGSHIDKPLREVLAEDPQFLNQFIISNTDCQIEEVVLNQIVVLQPAFRLSEEACNALEDRKALRATSLRQIAEQSDDEDDDWDVDWDDDRLYAYERHNNLPENDQEWPDDYYDGKAECEEDDGWEEIDENLADKQFNHGGAYWDSRSFEEDTYNAMTDGQYDDYDDWRSRGGNMDDLFDGLGR